MFIIENKHPCGSKKECACAPGCGDDCKEFNVYAKIIILNEVIERIELDKNTFKSCGRSVMGHLRSMMLIREYGEELKREIIK